MAGTGGDVFNGPATFIGGTLSESYSIKTDWTATATWTLGIARDRWMIYGKAGAALADNSYSLSMTSPAFSFASSGDHQIVPGWTAGIGVKWAITDNWFVNAEYDFLDFGTRAAHVSGSLSATPTGFGAFVPAASFAPLFNQTISEIKVGVNYKIGSANPGSSIGPAAPVQYVYDWTGFYVGGHVGGGWQNLNISDPSATSILTNCCSLLGFVNNPSTISSSTSGGFLGGVQAGWMYQVGQLVVGVDADFTGTNINGAGNSVSPSQGAGYFVNANYTVRTNWTATATADLGIANGLWMVYTKAGIAWADNSYGVNINGAGSQFGAPIPYSFAGSTTQIVPGWTIGLGVNWALGKDWFVNAEYDFLDFGTRVAHVSGAFSSTPATPACCGTVPINPAATFDPVFSQTISEVKIGLNYKPSGGYGTLLAKEVPKTDYNWSGYYIGGHIGGDWTATVFSDPGGYSTLNNCCLLISQTNMPGAAGDATGGGFLGGVQAGFMYQLRRLVVGADVDFSGSTLKGSGNFNYSLTPIIGGFANESYSVRTDWTSTSTAVIGFASNTWMIYGKAGAAMAQNNYSLAISGIGANFRPDAPFAFNSSTSDIVFGWTVGAGLKWGISSNWFVNAEYDFLDFGAKAENFPGNFTAAPATDLGTAATFHPSFAPNISEVKLGLNYKLPPSLSLW